MSMPHGQKTISILSLMRERGSLNYLEVEREIAGAQARGITQLSKMKRSGYIQALPKEPGRLKRYGLTSQGEKLLRLYLKDQERLSRPSVMDRPAYVPPADVCARMGAMRAFSLPSRGMRT